MSNYIFERFNDNHIEDAARLALSEYHEERGAVPVLPAADYYSLFCGMLSGMTGHGLGVAAIDGGELAGFLTCYEPRKDFFGTSSGTFSPIHAHGARKAERRRLYSLLYQKSAEKWVKEGILSHAVALYPHDSDTVDSFFRNGFGLRCVDAVRATDPIPCGDLKGYMFCELQGEEIVRTIPLKNSLIGHLSASPCFMPRFETFDRERLLKQNKERGSRYFGAFDYDKIIAFIEVAAGGENFACDDPSMKSICGAYLLPEYRGTGIYTKVLSLLIDTLAKEGYSRCGVDFESINPTAAGFWLKHFTAYTHSVTRRIDERIISHS